MNDPRQLLADSMTEEEAAKVVFFLNLLRQGGGYGTIELVYGAGRIREVDIKVSGLIGKAITPLKELQIDL